MTVIHILDHNTDKILGDSTTYYDENHVENLKREETLYFIEPPNSKITSFLNKKNRVVVPVDNGFYREFIIEEVTGAEEKEVYCSASHIELKNFRPISPTVLNGATVNTSLDYILKDTGWKRGITDYRGTCNVVFDEYITPYDALLHISNLDIYDLELQFRIEVANGRVSSRYVDMVNKRGKWRGREIESKRDLISAKRTEITRDVVTALYGIGPEKEDGTREVVIVEDDEARQVWGRKVNGVIHHIWGIYIPPNSQEITKERLKELAEKELEKRINSVIQYEVQGIDIEQIFDIAEEKVELGDYIRIKATEYNPPLFLESRIISIEGPIRNRSQKKYTLGEFIEYTEREVKYNWENLKNKISEKVSLMQLKNFSEPKKIISDKPPVNAHDVVWVDTSQNPYVPKVYNLGMWEKMTPTVAEEIGAYNKTQVDDITSDADRLTKGIIDVSAVTLRTSSDGARVEWDGSKGLVQYNSNNIATSWLDLEGNAHFENGYFNGEIHAESGTFKGILSGATGTFSGKVETSQLIVDNPNIEQDGMVGLRLQTAAWQANEQQPFRKTGHLEFNTLNDALEIYKINLSGDEVPLDGFRINVKRSEFIGDVIASESLYANRLFTKTIYSSWDQSKFILNDYQNGSISINALGNNLYLGYVNTSEVVSNRPFRTVDLYVNSIRANTSSNVYLRVPDSGGEVVVSSSTSTADYKPIRASDFINSSSEMFKTKIHKYKGSALELFNQAVIYQYLKNGETEYGFITERETPKEVIRGNGVSSYSIQGLIVKAIQELFEQMNQMKGRLGM
nr:phage tail spike protein [Priestia megaterium]